MKVQDWGLIEYTQAFDRQLKLVEERADGQIDDQIIVCRHTPVVTLGRATKISDLGTWQGATVETNRGGRTTYHGPGQVVIYPIISLAESRDLHAYLRALENGIIESLFEFGLKAEAKDGKGEGGESFTGVWVGDRKIASIGIAVKKWVTHHGLALNVEEDPLAFTGISPCGFQTNIMTSLQAELGASINYEKVKRSLVACVEKQLMGITSGLVTKKYQRPELSRTH